MKQAKLVLEDGRVFVGNTIGYDGETIGEVVFNTSMTGYQEILTDPSYSGQMVTLTYPMIGNYGINLADAESERIHVRALIVKEYSKHYANYRASMSLDDYLSKQKIMALQGIDTRALVRHIRDKGAMRGIISSQNMDESDLLIKVNQSPGMSGTDLAKVVTCQSAYSFNEPLDPMFLGYVAGSVQYHVVVVDFGVKKNILRSLVSLGCLVTVVPASITAAEIAQLEPDGVLLSNGPGDPAAVTYAIDMIRTLLTGSIPMFGICLGHQLLGLALGATTYKLKFGHRGGNQPVMRLSDRLIEITSQNHGFSIDAASIDLARVNVTHRNLNDDTIEGLEVIGQPFFSVQYHPEASPGPHDSSYLFHRFLSDLAVYRSLKKGV